MQTTSVIYKLLPSLLNISVTLAVSLPFLWLFGDSLRWKLAWIVIFFVYNLVFEFSYRKRDPGMILFKTHYERSRTPWQKLLYIVLYSVSFSTLLFYIWFPFDLLLINLAALQLPIVLLTGNTLHGFLSGNVKTIRKIN